jgi:hypothetical protein
MRGQALLAATILATSLLAVPAASAQQHRSYHEAHVSQQQQCQQQRNGRTAAGAIIGGLAGAVLGSQVAGTGHRTDGSLLAGVLGAAAGAAVGRSSARCDQPVQGSYDPYYGQPQDQYGQQPYRGDGYRDDRGRAPRDDGYGLEGGPYRESNYGGRSNGGQCRYGEVINRDPDGYEVRDTVYMCRDRNGVWRPA